MRQASENIYALITPVVEALGYELVGIEYLPQGRNSLLRIFIDSAEGIRIDDCERVSHQVSGVLDVEDPIKAAYSLEVSSPGLDRPLFRAEHFARFAGQQVKLLLQAPMDGRRKFTGELCGMEGGDVILTVDGQRVAVAFAAIEKANLVPEI